MTPRKPSTSARVTGCRYATIASVSSAAGERWFFGGSKNRSTSSLHAGLAVRRQPPPTSRSVMPRSRRNTARSASAALIASGSASVAAHKSLSVAGSLATKSTASRRLRRLGKVVDRTFRHRCEHDVVEHLGLFVADFARSDQLEHGEKRDDDFQGRATGD